MKKFLLLLFITLLIACSEQKVEKTETKVIPKPEKNIYGLITDSLKEFSSTVKKNETISTILNKHNLPLSEIYKITNEVKDTFDFRKIRKGNNYKIFSKIDSVETVQFMVYELDPVNFVVLDLRDSIYAFSGKKPVEIREKFVEGVIKSSLYETMQECNAPFSLALALSDVYAWQIDFFRVRKGDSFKVVYEEKYINGEFIGIGRILTSSFKHMNDEFLAFGYDDGEGFNYYDENGGSLRKEFLKSPVKFSRISSRFSYSRLHPILKYRRPHLGIDFAAPLGTPVRAVGDGVVIERKYKGQAGRLIKIRHNSTYQSAYLHLARYAKGIKVGKKVAQGDIIGYVGSSGLSTGPHLDFRFWKNGQLVNFLTQKFSSSKPLPDSLLEDFNRKKEVLLAKLSHETDKSKEKLAKNADIKESNQSKRLSQKG